MSDISDLIGMDFGGSPESGFSTSSSISSAGTSFEDFFPDFSFPASADKLDVPGCEGRLFPSSLSEEVFSFPEDPEDTDYNSLFLFNVEALNIDDGEESTTEVAPFLEWTTNNLDVPLPDDVGELRSRQEMQSKQDVASHQHSGEANATSKCAPTASDFCNTNVKGELKEDHPKPRITLSYPPREKNRRRVNTWVRKPRLVQPKTTDQPAQWVAASEVNSDNNPSEFNPHLHLQKLQEQQRYWQQYQRQMHFVAGPRIPQSHPEQSRTPPISMTPQREQQHSKNGCATAVAPKLRPVSTRQPTGQQARSIPSTMRLSSAQPQHFSSAASRMPIRVVLLPKRSDESDVSAASTSRPVATKPRPSACRYQPYYTHIPLSEAREIPSAPTASRAAPRLRDPPPPTVARVLPEAIRRRKLNPTVLRQSRSFVTTGQNQQPGGTTMASVRVASSYTATSNSDLRTCRVLPPRNPSQPQPQRQPLQRDYYMYN